MPGLVVDVAFVLGRYLFVSIAARVVWMIKGRLDAKILPRFGGMNYLFIPELSLEF